MAQLPGIVAGHGGSGTTTTVTITAAAAGNVLIAFISAFRGAGARTVSSIASTNTTWAKVVGTSSGSLDVEIWAGVVAGGASGTTVTITMSGSGSTLAVRVDEYTGLAISGSAVVAEAGQSVTNTSTSVTPQIPSAGQFPINTGDLFLACAGFANGTTPSAQPPAPWVANTFVNNSTTVGIQGNYIPNASSDLAAITWTITSALWVTAATFLQSSVGYQADFIKARSRVYEAPDPEIYPRTFQTGWTVASNLGKDQIPQLRMRRLYDAPDAEVYPVSVGKSWLGPQQPPPAPPAIQIPILSTDYRLIIVESLGRRRKTFIPDASNLGNDQTPWRTPKRLYEAPDPEIYPRLMFPSWETFQQFDRTEYWIPLKRFAESFYEEGYRRGHRWIPDNSNLGAYQMPELRMHRQYDAPDADPGVRRNYQFLPDASRLGDDQIPWKKFSRLFEAPDAEVYPRTFSTGWTVSSNLNNDQVPWIRIHRLYDAPDAEPGVRRNYKFQPDASNLNNNQVPWIRTNRLYILPDAEIYSVGRYNAASLPVTIVVDQLGWRQLKRLYESPDADIYAAGRYNSGVLPITIVVDQLGWRVLPRLYNALDAELGQRRGGIFLPDNSSLGADQLPWHQTNRLYSAPDPDPGLRRDRILPDNSNLGADQIPQLRLRRQYDAPDPEPGARRDRILPDNSNLGNDQTSHLTMRRLYDAPDANPGVRRNYQFLPDASNLNNDQVPWIRVHRLFEALDAELYARYIPASWLTQIIFVDQLDWKRFSRLYEAPDPAPGYRSGLYQTFLPITIQIQGPAIIMPFMLDLPMVFQLLDGRVETIGTTAVATVRALSSQSAFNRMNVLDGSARLLPLPIRIV